MTQRNGWLVIFAIAFTGEAAHSQCPEWASQFEQPATLKDMYVSHVHDDGSGPALYVAGTGTIAGLQLNGIGRWDGTEWSALGTGLSSEPYAMESFDDGNGMALYVGGDFLLAGGVSTKLARWDGFVWSPVATFASFNPDVLALQVWDDGSGPALYVGGYFDSVDGVPVTNLARWDGTTWSDVGGGLDALVYELEVVGGALYVAGSFDTAGGIPAPGFARWDGVGWTSLIGSSLVPEIGFSLGQWDFGSGMVLLVGGRFAGFNHITAAWDGADWTQLGPSGLEARDFEVHDDGNGPSLYMSELDGPYRWDGQDWVQVGTGLTGSGNYCETGPGDLRVFDEGNGPRLFAVGAFSQAGPGKAARNIARWDGVDWSAVLPGGLGLDVKSSCTSYTGGFHVDEFHQADLGDGARLYVGGSFIHAGGLNSEAVAAWDGTAWSPVGGITSGPIPGSVSALQAWDDGNGMALFAGGGFSWIGVSALNMARWNGVSWENIGDFNGSVTDLAIFTSNPGGERLYAAGSFIAIEGVPMQRIARWKGNNWLPLNGGGLDKPARALVVFDDGNGPALFAGGNFTTAGTAAVSKIARYDGTSWSDVGGGVAGGNIHALCVHDDGSGPALFVAGEFTSVGTTGAAYVAKWDGTAWSSLAGGNPDGPVYTLASHDEGDGRGPGLHAGGSFAAAGGVAASNLARWDPAGWSPLTSGTNHEVYALASFDDGSGVSPSLYVGGRFTTAGGQESSAIARWSNSCPCQGTSYCTAGTTTNGCNALISSTGSASRSLASGFDVAVLGVEGEKQGLVFFGMSGGKAMPWGTGTSYFCVKGPSTRTNVQGSGGNSGQCDGTFALDFNAWMAANPAKAPPPGGQVWMQSWFRDPPAPKSTSLSDALTFSVCP